MALPALATRPDARALQERTNRLVREFNRIGQDTFPPIYAADAGSATAYVIAPVPGVKQYIVGQIFTFKAANANTGTAPTLNVNGLGAGTITYPDGSALVAGDIAANGFYLVQVASTTPTFHLQTPRASVPINNSGATTFLANDVALNNTANFFNGPNTGSLTAGTYLLLAHATMIDSAGQAGFVVQIHNGTSAVDGIYTLSVSAGATTFAALSVVVTISSATTFTLQVKDASSTSGTLLTTSSAPTNKATNITWVRLA